MDQKASGTDAEEALERARREILSWELAVELHARASVALRLFRAFPGGGQYDVLWLLGENEVPDIRLNRTGTIQVFAGAPLEPVTWDEYRRDPGGVVEHVALAASLRLCDVREGDRPAGPESSTYRLLLGILRAAEEAWGSCAPLSIDLGYIDTSGYGGGEDPTFRSLGFGDRLTAARPGDFFGEPGYRFWIVRYAGDVVGCIEQSTGELRRAGTSDVWHVDGMAPAVQDGLCRTVLGWCRPAAPASPAAMAPVGASGCPPRMRIEGTWMFVDEAGEQHEVIAVAVEEVADGAPGEQVVLEHPGGALTTHRLDGPVQVATRDELHPSGRDLLLVASPASKIVLRGPVSSDTSRVLGIPLVGDRELAPEDVARAIELKDAWLRGPGPRATEAPFMVLMSVSDGLDRVNGVELASFGNGFQGFGREERTWLADMTVWRETIELEDEDDEEGLLIEDVSGWPVPVELADTMVRLFDCGVVVPQLDLRQILGKVPVGELKSVESDRALPLPGVLRELLDRVAALEGRVRSAGGFDVPGVRQTFLTLRRALGADNAALTDVLRHALDCLDLARTDLAAGRTYALDELGFHHLTYGTGEGAEYLRDMSTWPG